MHVIIEASDSEHQHRYTFISTNLAVASSTSSLCLSGCQMSDMFLYAALIYAWRGLFLMKVGIWWKKECTTPLFRSPTCGYSNQDICTDSENRKRLFHFEASQYAARKTKTTSRKWKWSGTLQDEHLFIFKNFLFLVLLLPFLLFISDGTFFLVCK